MLFATSKILWMLISPANFLALLLALGVFLSYRDSKRLRRYGRGIILTVSLGMLVLLVLPVDVWVLWPLEHQYSIPKLPDKVDGVIVLGGAVDTDASVAYGIPHLNQNADRMTEFLYLAHRYPEARLIFSGGSGSLIPSKLTESMVARSFFERLGLTGPRLLFEDRSRNTYENIKFSQALVQPKSTETWVLVTSAYNMPRAMGIAQKLGWRSLIPYPVGFYSSSDNMLRLNMNLNRSLMRLSEGLHEFIGIASYRLLGRSN